MNCHVPHITPFCDSSSRPSLTSAVLLCVTRERPTYVERLKSNILGPGHSILKPLNVYQRRAVLKALAANDYFLIKGMPGTGEQNFVTFWIWTQ
jgi:hypothetical protein